MSQPVGSPNGHALPVKGSSGEGRDTQSAQNCPGELLELLPQGCSHQQLHKINFKHMLNVVGQISLF